MTALQAAPFKPEGPQPLVGDIAPGEPYPVQALGPLQTVVEAVQGMTQAPVAIPAQVVQFRRTHQRSAAPRVSLIARSLILKHFHKLFPNAFALEPPRRRKENWVACEAQAGF